MQSPAAQISSPPSSSHTSTNQHHSSAPRLLSRSLSPPTSLSHTLSGPLSRPDPSHESIKPADPGKKQVEEERKIRSSMELYMDEKWKLSKKGSRNSSCSASRRMVVGEGGPFLKRSASMRERKSSSGSPRSFSSRCCSLVKEQRARFYIMRRCVTMLICWRDYP